MTADERERRIRVRNARHATPDCLCDWCFILGRLDAERKRRAMPDPAGGCACIPHDDGYHYGSIAEPGGALEYSPACPVHSEHLYDPRKGVWIFADPKQNAAWEADRAALAENRPPTCGHTDRACVDGDAPGDDCECQPEDDQ